MSKRLQKLLLIIPLLTTSACQMFWQRDSDDSSSGGTDDSTTDNDGDGDDGEDLITNEDIAGVAWGDCTDITDPGTAWDGYSYLPSFSIQANGIIRYSLSFFDGPNCQLGSNNPAFAYSVLGAYTIDGAAASPSGAAQMTIYWTEAPVATVYAGNAAGGYWAAEFNDYCAVSPKNVLTGADADFSTNSTSTRYVGSLHCSDAGPPPLVLDTFPAASGSVKTLVVYDADADTITFKTPDILWYPGKTGGSYPNGSDASSIYEY